MYALFDVGSVCELLILERWMVAVPGLHEHMWQLDLKMTCIYIYTHLTFQDACEWEVLPGMISW